ncbi:MAG TPA: amidase family protein [Candidatus Acidoferrales bacterium]|nr:amidase family protein [Candidatus Acidoferrales bacterium]
MATMSKAQIKELAWLDATAQAELVRRKEVQPFELVDATIACIERLNPQLNAVILPLYDQARAAAQSEALPDGPFRGVPFLIKDLVASYAGVRQASGCAFTRDLVAARDSELVRRWKRAGLIIVGKTNTSELGILPTAEPRLFGASRNPWNSNRSTGGSSGGSSSAVAAGFVPAAHANDGGGSIRIPASCCGLFGLKPTRARVPLGPDFGDLLGGLVAEHAVTRSVRDSAALLDAVAGPELGDPYAAPAIARPFLAEVGASPGRLRIGFSAKAPAGAPVHGDCVQAVEDAAKLCAELSHTIEEASPAIDGPVFRDTFVSIWAASVAWNIVIAEHLMRRKARPEDFEPLTWALVEMGRKISAADYMLAWTSLQGMCRRIAQFFETYDMWLTPTVSQPPLPLGHFDAPPEVPLLALSRATDFVAFTPFANATGQPAMSVPLFWNAEGLPVGVHFAARFGDEASLFRLAAQLEQARPWVQRHPPVSA